MYADVVMDKANDLKNFKIRIKLEKILEKIKSKKKYMHDSDIIESDLEKVCFEFKKKISNIIKDRTVIIIAHRKSTLKQCNKIIEIKDRKILNHEINKNFE